MWRDSGGGLLCLLLFLSSVPGAAEEIRDSGNRLFLPVEINGHKVEALLDSGAELTLIDAAKAEEIGLNLAGSAEARGTGKGTESVWFAQGVEIRAAGVVLRNRTAAVLDLNDVATRLVGEPLSAVLGRDLFDTGRFRLNIEERRLKRVSNETPPESVHLPLKDQRGIKQFPVRIEGRDEVFADFDLGNGSEMLIGQEYAIANSLLTEDRLAGTRRGGGIGGPIERQIVRIVKLEIAGTEFRNIEAVIDPLPGAPDANIGVALLRRFEMTIDFSENAVWLKPVEEKR